MYYNIDFEFMTHVAYNIDEIAKTNFDTSTYKRYTVTVYLAPINIPHHFETSTFSA